MTALILDTSNACASIALCRQGEVLDSTHFVHNNQLSRIFFTLVIEILSKNNLSLSDLNYVATGIGPGSYTGTRVSATTAKALAFALGIPVIGFHSLKAFLPKTDGRFALLLKAKMHDAYILKGLKINNTFHFEPPAFVDRGALHTLLQDTCTTLVFEPESSARSIFGIENAECAIESAVFNPSDLARLVHGCFTEGDFSQENRLDLIYLYNPGLNSKSVSETNCRE